MLLLASGKAKSDVHDLISAEAHPLPHSGDPRGIVIRLKMIDGYSRVVMVVRPDGTWKVMHPAGVDDRGNIFDESFDRELATVLLHAAAFRDP